MAAGDKNVRMPTWVKKAASCLKKRYLAAVQKTAAKKSRFLLELNEMPNEDGRGAIVFVRNVFNFLYARNCSFLDMVLLN